MTPERWRQIEELFHSAREHGLAALADADPDLRYEVEKLLEQDGSDGKILDRPAADLTLTIVGVGSQLGPYKIAATLGSGGMGAVFRAVDTRLGRSVAIKTSREQFSDRFDREARAISSLNHPHICTLHDVGPNYLVMELCEGETLAARLKRGKVSIQETLRYGAQIADALAAAHAKGITHRDLKPGNIMLGKSGIKVLDFGLAKSPQDLTLTGTRMVMGTPAYMAPEQREGKECDARTDIYSLGLVLYEMATGKQADQGQTPAKGQLPEKLDHVIQRCLTQDPEHRWQSARDVQQELEWAATSTPLLEGAPEPGGARRLWLAWSVATVLTVITVVALWALGRAEKPADRPLVRLDVDLGSDVHPRSNVFISPDGTRLVYQSGTPARLFTRRLDQPKATALPGTEGSYTPFFSPDGKWVGFETQGKLKKISVEGGAVVTLADLIAPSGGGWGEDGNILVADSYKGLVRVPAGGGPPEMVAGLSKGEAAVSFEQILPGGKVIFFISSTFATDTASIHVMTLADRRGKIVVQRGHSPRYLSASGGAGYLVYIDNATLFAIPFDLDKLETRGTAVPILDDVAGSVNVSRTGTLVYRKKSAEDTGLLTVGWIEGAGKTEPLLAKLGLYGRLTLSPDGQRLALEVKEGSEPADIWVYDWRRDTMTRVTFSGNAQNPVWSSDGRYIVFQEPGEGMSVTRSDGAGKPLPLTRSKNVQIPWSFTPDGKWLAYQEVDSTLDLWTVPLESDGAGLHAGKPEVFLQTPAFERSPSFSPDGRWLAYSSDESGTYQVYVRAFPDKGGKWQISNSGGMYPMWSRNGREFFFETLDNRIMVAAYTVKGDSFVPDKPRMWSERKLGGGGGIRNVDIAPDGKRMAALLPAPAQGAQQGQNQNQVVFLENFVDELRRKVPTGR